MAVSVVSSLKAYSFWDSKYDESDSSGKNILDAGARKWFSKGFKELDEEDQQTVVNNEGYRHGDHVNTKSRRWYKGKLVRVINTSNGFEVWVGTESVGVALSEEEGFFRAEEYIDMRGAKSFEQKAIGSPFKIELKDGMVVSTTGVMIDNLPDLYRDVCTKECLKDMVAQLNERVFTMDIEHNSFRGDPSTKALNVARIPISKITEAMYREADGVAQVVIKDSLNASHSRFNEVSGSIANGYLHSYSIAFVPEKVAMKTIDNTVYRFLGKVNLLNVTYTGVPVNPRAVMEDVVMKSKDEISRFTDNTSDLDFKDFSSSRIEAKSISSKEESLMADDVSLKDLSARIAVLEKENASLKAQLESKAEEEKEDEEEKKKVEAEEKSLVLTIADLKAKIAEHEKILNTPYVKGARSQMEADLKAQVDSVKLPSLLRTM
jgi:uncharacterized small protein (DUF1192 family)